MNTLGKGHDSGWLNINRGGRISIKIINHWHALVLALKCPSRSISNPHTSSLYKTDFSFEWEYVQHPDTNCIEVIVVSRIKSSRYQPFQVKYPDQYTVHFSHDCKLSGNHFTWRAVKTKEITTSQNNVSILQFVVSSLSRILVIQQSKRKQKNGKLV